MSAVSVDIAREYFEALGFFVQQPVKYQVAARRKRMDEEVDFMLVRPLRTGEDEEPFPARVIWTTSDMKAVRRAVVSVRGWHTDRFSPSLLEEHPEIFHFASEKVLQQMTPALGPGRVARILCLPELPAHKKLAARALEILRENGIDGVLLFKTMLMELAARIDENKSYEKSDLLQILRILKSNDLLRDAQLELFGVRKRQAE